MAVIKIENLSKQYRLGQVGTGTISHDVNRWWHKIRGKEDPYLKIGESNDRTVKGDSDYVWALKDINFEVKQGEVLGIIGRNGAGKSTLLKILSRTTSPTTGSVKINGRVASLLEVGTGFHPELSGRDNIFLNGSILGMTKREIQSKFDEILDFSGVERYIDTPVKRYSSGMYVRLAFAVAAHLEPEILIVDEVLAVGDAEFQKKCLGKIKDVSVKDGRTVIFVSHNMAAVKSLCNKGILFINGNIAFEGETSSVVTKYMHAGSEYSNKWVSNDNFKSKYFKLKEIIVKANGKSDEDSITEYDEVRIETIIEIFNENEKLHFTYVIKDENGDPIFTFSHIQKNIKLQNGTNKLTCKFPNSFLNIGSYYMDAYLIKNAQETVFVQKDILAFNVQEGEREVGSWMGREPGLIKPVFEWENQLL